MSRIEAALIFSCVPLLSHFTIIFPIIFLYCLPSGRRKQGTTIGSCFACCNAETSLTRHAPTNTRGTVSSVLGVQTYITNKTRTGRKLRKTLEGIRIVSQVARYCSITRTTRFTLLCEDSTLGGQSQRIHAHVQVCLISDWN